MWDTPTQISYKRGDDQSWSVNLHSYRYSQEPTCLPHTKNSVSVILCNFKLTVWMSTWRKKFLFFLLKHLVLNDKGEVHIRYHEAQMATTSSFFHPRALNFWYVGANVLNERCTKFQVRSFILSSTTNFTFSSDFTKNLFSFTFFLFERFFHHWLQRKTNRNKWQKCLLWLLE